MKLNKILIGVTLLLVILYVFKTDFVLSFNKFNKVSENNVTHEHNNTKQSVGKNNVECEESETTELIEDENGELIWDVVYNICIG